MQSLLPTINKELFDALRNARNINTPAIELFNAYVDQLERRPNGWSVINNIRNLKYFSRSFRNGAQEDAQEFLNGFLDRLREEFEKIERFKGKNNPILKNYVSSYDSRYYCTKCGQSNIKTPSIQEELTFFLEMGDNIPSLLNSAYGTGNNCYSCEICKTPKGSAKMNGVFTSLPRTFICCIKRFKHSIFHGEKLTHEVALTNNIKLPFINSHNNRQMVNYALSSIVIHLGHSINSGHYECVTHIGDKWYRISDSQVMNINEAMARASSKCSSYIYTYTQCQTERISRPIKRRLSDPVSLSKNKIAKLNKFKHNQGKVQWKNSVSVPRSQNKQSPMSSQNINTKAVVCQNS